VRDPGGTGEALVVIEKNPVLFDVSELVRVEQKLPELTFVPRPFVGRIQIRGEATWL